MKITELKAGMIVEYNDGDLGIIFPEINKVLFQDSYVDFSESVAGNKILFDNIFAVHEMQNVYSINDCFDKKNLKCVWKKPEKEYKGFTEITEALLVGKKLRCEHWNSGSYIHTKDNKLYEVDTEVSSLWTNYPMVEYKEELK